MRIKQFEKKILGASLAGLLVLFIAVVVVLSENVSAGEGCYYSCFCLCEKAGSFGIYWGCIDGVPSSCEEFCRHASDAELKDLAIYLESHGINTEECIYWERMPEPEFKKPETPKIWDVRVPDLPFLDPKRPRDLPAEGPPTWLD